MTLHGVQVLHALLYLQQHLCLHRDVKGSNILLTDSCEVKLVDYGISCQVTRTPHSHTWKPDKLMTDLIMNIYYGLCPS